MVNEQDTNELCAINNVIIYCIISILIPRGHALCTTSWRLFRMIVNDMCVALM